MLHRPEFVGRRYVSLINHPFEAGIAFAATVSAVVGMLDPTSVNGSVLGRTARELLPVWQVLYALAGVLILFGLLRSLRTEAAGLCLLVAAVLIQVVSLIHLTGTTGLVSAATYGAIATAAVIRIRVLVWLQKAATRDDQ